MILENGDTKPQMTTFNNETQRLLHKEYENLRVIEYLVYRTAVGRECFMRIEFAKTKNRQGQNANTLFT